MPSEYASAELAVLAVRLNGTKDETVPSKLSGEG